MARVAGNKPTYAVRICRRTEENGVEVLIPTETGYDLPGVTEIIGAVWKSSFINAAQYGYNLAANVAQEVYGVEPGWFRAEGKRRMMTPETHRQERADEGNVAHGVLEAVLKGEPIEPPTDSYSKQVYDWAIANPMPKVWSERTLLSLQGGFAGTADVTQFLDEKQVVVKDLKTRKRLEVYDTDRIQVWGYADALEEMYPNLTVVGASIIVATPKACKEYDVDFKFYNVWKNTLAAYRSLKGELTAVPEIV